LGSKTASGGIIMLKNMSAPYLSLGVKFCPTGGVSLDNMNEWLALPVVSAIGGTWLATQKQIADKQWDVITENVKAALSATEKISGK
jgi:2-dehydro-3-deoxyphosphogluconate aldolase/(4S)-4-hydroxy-2-oxoglutarate aldolase